MLQAEVETAVYGQTIFQTMYYIPNLSFFLLNTLPTFQFHIFHTNAYISYKATCFSLLNLLTRFFFDQQRSLRIQT